MAVTNKIAGSEKLIRKLHAVSDRYIDHLITIINTNTNLEATYIRQHNFAADTTKNTLRTRTGRLRASIRSKKAKVSSHAVTGGILFGTKYAKTHIGPKGSKQLIRVKNKKWLTIPLPAAMTKAGRLKGEARSDRFTNTFLRKTKKGNLIIFGNTTYAKGLKTGQANSGIVPLFLLKKQVRVPRRIDPEDSVRRLQVKTIKDLRKVVMNV